MQKKRKQLSLFTAALAALVITASSVLALPPRANAHAETAGGLNRAAGVSQAETHQPIQAAAGAQNGQTNGQSHLAAAKLKSCQNRQKAIDNIMTRLAIRGQKQLTLFGTIATRVENFYTQKGKTLSNYDSLVADVNAKQAAAQTEVDAIKTASTGFSCDSSDPKAFVDSFKASLKSEISALKDYRTSVKNLIVGVKSVESTTASSTDQNTTSQDSTNQTNQNASSGGSQ